MKKWLPLLLTTLTALTSLCLADPPSPTSADELLRDMRRSMSQQRDRDVMGTIRKNALRVPFSISSRGDTIAFQYKQDNTWKRFDVRIGNAKADILLVDRGKAIVMAPASYAQTIAGTDVTYEDLSLRFLYWKGGTILPDSADSRIKSRDCYVVQVVNPTPNVGQFATVRMWIDKENGAVLQMDGYGRNGKLKKRFTITSIKRLSDGTWFFKQMKIEIRNPENDKRTIALNYLEMDDIPNAKK